MKKNSAGILLSFALTMISPNVFAYLDPGTGGMIIQAIIAIFVGAGLFFSHLRLKISAFYNSILQRLKGNDTKSTEPEENQPKE